MVYRDKIQLPTNTFTNLMAIRTCESEAECEKRDLEDPDGEKYGDPFGIHIPNTPEINLCFTKYKDKCKIYLAMKLNDLDPEATANLEIETISVGCRALDLESQNWSRDGCKVLKSSQSSFTGSDF